MRASRMNVQASVLECMAIRPDLVAASERDLVRATIAVVTNLRPDHFEDMPSADAMVEGIMGMVPRNGVLVADENALSARLRAHAAALRTRVVAVPTTGLAADAANRAVAMAVCAVAGIHIDLPQASPLVGDPGQFTIGEFKILDKQFRFANAFACNDAVSLAMLWHEHRRPDESVHVVLNHRHDRPLRSMQFLDYFAALPERPPILLLRASTWLRRAARRRGLEICAVPTMPWLNGRDIVLRIAARIPDGAFVWGVGNYHGPGAEIVQALKAEDSCSH